MRGGFEHQTVGARVVIVVIRCFAEEVRNLLSERNVLFLLLVRRADERPIAECLPVDALPSSCGDSRHEEHGQLGTRMEFHTKERALSFKSRIIASLTLARRPDSSTRTR
jgi:hypothetical protein